MNMGLLRDFEYQAGSLLRRDRTGQGHSMHIKIGLQNYPRYQPRPKSLKTHVHLRQVYPPEPSAGKQILPQAIRYPER